MLIVGLIFFFHPPEQGQEWVLAYLIDMSIGSGGESGAGKRAEVGRMELAPMPAPPASAYSPDVSNEMAPALKLPDAIAVPPPHSGVMQTLTVAALRPLTHRARIGTSGESGQGTGGASGTGAGSGSGEGSIDGKGDGNLAMAYADYGSNPSPGYPTRSRQREEEGTVMLRVLVAIDGSVERVVVAESSGFEALDHAAEETVRTRWRFVPAQRAGRPIASWVLVPIKFALK